MEGTTRPRPPVVRGPGSGLATWVGCPHDNVVKKPVLRLQGLVAPGCGPAGGPGVALLRPRCSKPLALGREHRSEDCRWRVRALGSGSRHGDLG